MRGHGGRIGEQVSLLVVFHDISALTGLDQPGNYRTLTLGDLDAAEPLH